MRRFYGFLPARDSPAAAVQQPESEVSRLGAGRYPVKTRVSAQ